MAICTCQGVLVTSVLCQRSSSRMWKAQLTCTSTATDLQTLNSTIFIYHNTQLGAQTQLINTVEGNTLPFCSKGEKINNNQKKEHTLKQNNFKTAGIFYRHARYPFQAGQVWGTSEERAVLRRHRHRAGSRSHTKYHRLCLQGTKLVINHRCNKPQYVQLISCQSDISIIKRFKSDPDYFNHNALHRTSLQSLQETDNSVPFQFLLAFQRLCPLFTHLVICDFIMQGYVWQRKICISPQ